MLDLLVLSLAGCCATAQPAVPPPSRVRTVPCEEVIDHVRFPYLGNRDPRYRARLVLDAVSAPGAVRPADVADRVEAVDVLREVGDGRAGRSRPGASP